MNLFVALLSLALVQLSIAEDAEAPKVLELKEGFAVENGVIIATDANFAEVIKANEFVLVEFYAPWCGHCKSLAPEYDKAAKILEEKESKIKLAKLDATIHTEQAKEYKIQGFPTLKFFRNGVAVDYQGPRTAEGIVAWLEKKTGPVAIDLADVASADKLIEDNEVVVIGFFKALKSEKAKLFLEEAAAHDSIVFGITSSEELVKHYKAKDNQAVLFKKFDDKRAEFVGDFKEFGKFVKLESTPLVLEFSQEAAPKIFGSDIKVHFLLFISKSDKEGTEKQLATLTSVAKTLKGEALFVSIDADVPEHQNVMDYFGFKKDALPIYLIFEVTNQRKYIADNKKVVKGDEVKKFFDDYKAKNLTPFMKTEEIPEDWDSEPVKVLVGKNFEKVAKDKTKNVFVEFYAPWCGHCKSLAPEWEKLGEKYEDHADIVIAKMDGTANEVEGVQIQGFPTLILYKKDTNEEVTYTGKRDFESLSHFLETGEIKLDKQDVKVDDEEAKKEEERETKTQPKKKDEKKKPDHTEL